MVKNQHPFLQNPGSMLSDQDIMAALKSGFLKIKSPYPLKMQPASMDLHIAPTIMVFARRRIDAGLIDLKKPIDKYVEFEVMDPQKGVVLHPGEFILGVTEEWFEMPSRLLANVDGKSSLGRLGLVIHATAGFVDPGFRGHITLEITNLTDQPMVIYPHIPIAQIRFSILSSPAENVYGSKVLGSKYVNGFSKKPKPMPSQYWKNFEGDKK